MQDHRRIARTRIQKRAKISACSQVIACRVCDITAHGACLMVDEPERLPTSFELSLDEFRTIRACRVMWRGGDRVGVAFVVSTGDARRLIRPV